jgi:hypothetical protein
MKRNPTHKSNGTHPANTAEQVEVTEFKPQCHPKYGMRAALIVAERKMILACAKCAKPVITFIVEPQKPEEQPNAPAADSGIKLTDA